MKEDKEASSFRLTTDCDLHQGGSVVTFVLRFFFLLHEHGDLWASVGVKAHSIGVKIGAKKSRSCKTQKRTITKRKMGKGVLIIT